MRSLLELKRPLSEPEAAHAAAQIIAGVQHLHSVGIGARVLPRAHLCHTQPSTHTRDGLVAEHTRP